MQNLLLYLYSRHIHSNDPNAQLFCKQESIRIFNLTQEQLQFYNTMLIRNFFTYSPATMEIKLSVKHLLGIYRLTKFEAIIQQNGLNAVWSQWIKNQMMPINYHGKKIQDSKFVYVDYKQENPKQDKKLQIQQPEIKQAKRKNSKTKQNEKQLNTKKSPTITQKHQQKLKTFLNINIIQLTIQLQNRLICAQLRIQPNDIIKPQKRLQALMVLQHQKIQQYINERFNTQILMVYNFINKYPYIDEKTLLNKTMLPIAQLRRSVAKLISQGWVNFYPQNSRSLLYKILPQQRIKQRCCNNIAQALLNMYIFLDKIQSSKQIMEDEQKTNVLLKSIQELDNFLMIFMA